MDAIVPKKFSWSWSRLKNYRACPKKHYHVDVAKEFKDESEALTWGNQVHDAMAKRIGSSIQLPPTMTRYDAWPANVAALKKEGMQVKIENKLAMDREFQPTSYFDPATWFRCVIDVMILIPEIRSAITIDWKTGNKVQPEFEQLALSSQVMFAHYPSIDWIGTVYVWLGHGTQTTTYYSRENLAGMWGTVMPTVKKMEEAHRTLTYEPKPSGLCKNWCPVNSCPHYGKGSF